MDGQAFREALEEAKATELASLESESFLIALGGDEPQRAPLLRAAADSEHAAHETFRRWADDESDARARGAFADVAAQEDEHRRRVLDALGGAHDPNDGGPLHTYLRGRESTVERIAAGMVARPLVSLQTHGRLIDFFADEADEARAALFRDLRAETAAVIDRGLSMLEDRCDDEDWEVARMVAAYTIQVAHDDYEDALVGSGADP